jgi:hypothetical protein
VCADPGARTTIGVIGNFKYRGLSGFIKDEERNKPKSFKCKKIRTERSKKSSIPFMTNLLNKESEEKSLQMKEIDT